MDLAEQLSAVWARRYAVLLTALLVAGLVFVWRAESPERYEASSTLQVRAPDIDASDPSTQVEYFAETVVGLLTSRSVVTDALAEVGSDADPDDVSEEVVTETAGQPGFVTVTASGATADEAAALSDALVAAVDRRVGEDQAQDRASERAVLQQALADVLEQLRTLPRRDQATRASLIREREELLSAIRTNATSRSWRVAIVDAANPPSSPVSPVPLRDALLAFLIALIVVAEAIVIRRAWRGALSARDPAGDVNEALGVPAAAVRSDSRMAAVAGLLPSLGGASRFTVVQLGSRPGARTAFLLAGLRAAQGHEVLLVDARPERPSLQREVRLRPTFGLSDLPSDGKQIARALQGLPHVGGIDVLVAGRGDGDLPHSLVERVAPVSDAAHDSVVVAMSVARLDEVIPLLGEGGSGPVVLEVEAALVTKRQLREVAAAWRGVGIELVSATVVPDGERYRLRPRPRRPRAVPAAA